MAEAHCEMRRWLRDTALCAVYWNKIEGISPDFEFDCMRWLLHLLLLVVISQMLIAQGTDSTSGVYIYLLCAL